MDMKVPYILVAGWLIMLPHGDSITAVNFSNSNSQFPCSGVYRTKVFIGYIVYVFDMFVWHNKHVAGITWPPFGTHGCSCPFIAEYNVFLGSMGVATAINE